jgi:fumarylacetoacetase
MAQLDGTHDPARRSWVQSANRPDTDFPIQNLPLGVFRRGDGPARGGVAIGDRILDLAAALDSGLFAGEAEQAARAAAGATLNPLMALGTDAADALRARLSDLLRADGPERRRVEAMADPLLVPMAEARLELPAAIGAFTDFLTSSYHTERAGRATRPDSPLPPAFKWLPIAYNSRASSVRISGEAVRRPNGQVTPEEGGPPHFGPCRQLDFELELGAFIGPGNDWGAPVGLEAAPRHIFGYCLVNDWSARDIQRWESFPLGPFLSKSFATTISPWVVTAAALEPFRAPAFRRERGDPAPLPYLASAANEAEGHLDLTLEAFVLTPGMRAAGTAPARLARANFQNMYWTFPQMLTHHASNGCNLRPGDLVASGTVSGAADDSRACYLELSERGAEPVALPGGERRAWCEDGDEIVFRARAERPGFVAIGFGECRARIVPAAPWPGAG